MTIEGRTVRVSLVSPAGHLVVSAQIDEIFNADVQAPMTIRGDVQCDLGHWHPMGEKVLACWSPLRS